MSIMRPRQQCAGRDLMRRLLRQRALPLVLALLLLTVMPAVVIAQPPTPDIVPLPAPTLLVGIAESLAPSDYAAWFQSHDLELVRAWPELRLAQVQPARMVNASAHDAAAAVTAARAHLENTPDVRHVALDQRISAAATADTPVEDDTPDDPRLVEQWSLVRLRVFDTWKITTGSPAQVIAVIDSGVNRAHEDLPPGSLWTNPVEAAGVPGVDDDANGLTDDIHGWDWVENDHTPDDAFGHGTHVAGIIVATADNGIGVAGVAPGLHIMPLRVLDETGEGRVSDLIDALLYAESQGVRIVNLSLVLQEDIPALHDTIKWLAARDVLVVAAAGNMRTATLWPAAYAETVGVAATDSADRLAAFTSVDAQAALAAPGADILGLDRAAGYTLLSGTSMAAAHVSALAGLVLSLRPDLPSAAVLEMMRTAAVPIAPAPHEPAATVGRIDFYATLAHAAQDLQVTFGAIGAVPSVSGGEAVVPVRVVAGDGQTPVSDVRLRFQVTAHGARRDADAAPLAAGEVMSAADGVALLRFPVAADTDVCRIDVQLADTVYTTDLSLRRKPVIVRLDRTQTMVSVDDPGVTLRLELLDGQGRLIDGQVHLVVTYADDVQATTVQARAVPVSAGAAEVTLPVGRRRGTLSVSASSAGVTATHSIQVRAGPPARGLVIHEAAQAFEAETEAVVTKEYRRLVNAPQTDAENSWNGTEAQPMVPLRLAFFDRYGNPVEDGVQVEVAAEGAAPRLQHVTTANGVVDLLFVPTPGVRQIQIDASVPGTEVRLRHVASLDRHIILLPLMYGGR